MINKPYNNLYQLLSQNQTAKEYFMTLSEQEQGLLQHRTYEIHTVDDLHQYAKHATMK